MKKFRTFRIFRKKRVPITSARWLAVCVVDARFARVGAVSNATIVCARVRLQAIVHCLALSAPLLICQNCHTIRRSASSNLCNNHHPSIGQWPVTNSSAEKSSLPTENSCCLPVVLVLSSLKSSRSLSRRRRRVACVAVGRVGRPLSLSPPPSSRPQPPTSAPEINANNTTLSVKIVP